MTSPAPDLDEVDRASRRLVWQLTGALMVSIVVIGALVYVKADHASAQARAVCRAAKTIAEAPLVVSPRPSPLGLSISAGFRVAYVDAGCTLGKLKAADPQVVPYLPPGARYR